MGMMRKYLKESLHWLHLAFFKPVTLQAEAGGFTRRQAVRMYLRVLPVQLAVIVIVVVFAGILSELAGYRFPWSQALAGSLGFGLGVGLFWVLGGKLGVA